MTVNVQLETDSINLIWDVLVKESCNEFMWIQKCKTAKEFLDHKTRKDNCDELIKKLNDYRN